MGIVLKICVSLFIIWMNNEVQIKTLPLVNYQKLKSLQQVPTVPVCEHVCKSLSQPFEWAAAY